MLEWIPAFFEKATAWCPRLTRVPPTHRMVKWSKCGEGTLHGPGIIWHWPIVTETEDVDVRWGSCLCHVQSVTLADGVSVSARARTVWRVGDILTAVGVNQDYEDRVADSTMAAIVAELSRTNQAQLRDVGALNVSLTMANKSRLSECGIEVASCEYAELVVSPAYRIINESTQ